MIVLNNRRGYIPLFTSIFFLLIVGQLSIKFYECKSSHNKIQVALGLPLHDRTTKSNFSALKHPIQASITNHNIYASQPSSVNKIELKVKTMSGKIITIDNISGDDSILKIKREIEQKEGMPVGQQRIIVGGRQLEDHLTVNDYNLKADTLLHLVLRLRGGISYS